MKTAYLDCFSGISGDMLVGALLDLGLPIRELEGVLSSLPLSGYRIEARKEERNSLFGTRFLVEVEEVRQPHRTLPDIRSIFESSGFSSGAREKILEVFETIAREEARIHNLSPEKVHFHEVGAVDSIVDISGAVFGLEFLGIHTLWASSLPLGSGFVETRHGTIPVPSPATLGILKGAPVYDSGLRAELVTPTGAALLKTLVQGFGGMPAMTVEDVGYGVGTQRLPDRPNLLRILVGRSQSGREGDTVAVLEANLDDTNPEWLGFLMDRLFDAGALDVVFLPAYMKKNRPGILVQVLGPPSRRDALMEILFRESTTLGVRFQHVRRRILPRLEEELESPWGKLAVKRVQGPDGRWTPVPEYEACRRIAEREGVPLKEIYAWIISTGRK
ncbi:MAG: nickel pincer cofactor biosynthesis protein LarC [Deltaproteobacteria bacterium]|nr:nickel pincer cofactor biosynthesis protein LarC [Deltaproteobacteria bacterium]MBW2016644.1 nickel pincer cofactor biosynthesis protein LarC [Deltaproteobacteria bacterium]MBW2130814.1 nickel pincer cofactor biosynthesis protein LarC [Deltaproteobacteria bacterium]MBW2303752.1 nickel pincer cofactor biosynthesis protein LarC [Deltaproteobacteria bacterium]